MRTRTTFNYWCLRAGIAGLTSMAALGTTGSSALAEPWPLAPASNTAQITSQLFWFTLVLAGVVFVLVEALLISSSIRFRRDTPLGATEPPQIHGNTRLEVMWAVVPAFLLIGLFGVTTVRMGEITDVPVDGVHVTATGRQFQWEFAYPVEGVKSMDEMRIPVDQPVIIDVTATDVIHSFWVPELHGKVDALPGRVNRLWFQPNQTGTFRGVCAQLCGAGHAGMFFTVQVVSAADYAQWIQSQKAVGAPTGAAAATGGDPKRGQLVIQAKGCGTCHTIPGIQGAVGQIGPSLAGVAGRTRIAGGAVPNNGPADLKAWVLDPPALKPGTAMANAGLTDAEATDVVAFLETLK